MIEKNIKVYFSRSVGLQSIRAVQDDSGRVLKCTLADAEIPSGSTAAVYVRKPSGKSVYIDCTISGDEITVPLTAQMLAEPGKSKMQIRITHGSETVSTLTMILEVEGIIGQDAIESADDISFINAAIERAKEIIDEYAEGKVGPDPEIESRVATLEGKTATLETDMTQQKSSSSNLTSRVVVLEAQGETLVENVQDLTDRLETVEVVQDGISDHMSWIDEQLADLPLDKLERLGEIDDTMGKIIGFGGLTYTRGSVDSQGLDDDTTRNDCRARTDGLILTDGDLDVYIDSADATYLYIILLDEYGDPTGTSYATETAYDTITIPAGSHFKMYVDACGTSEETQYYEVNEIVSRIKVVPVYPSLLELKKMIENLQTLVEERINQ